MSYILIESSETQGFPVELYRFSSTGFDQSYYFTSSQEDVVYNGNTYVSTYIKRTQPELTSEKNAQKIQVTIARDNDLASKWLFYSPANTVWLTIYRFHLSDIDNQYKVFWQGRVRSAERLINEVQLGCDLIDSAFDREGLRRTFANVCFHMLYGTRCKVPKASFQNTGTISGVSGDTLSANTFANFSDSSPVPDGYWINGYVERSNGDVRFVVQHTGVTVTLLTPFEDMQVGETVSIFAGCDHAFVTCLNKFNNVINYGGFPYLPSENPFTIKLTS